MNASIKALLDILNGEVGQHEEGGNNLGPAVVKYQEATWLKPAAWPWCAAFCCWCVREWLKLPGVLAELKMTASLAELWRCKGANVDDWLHWAHAHGYSILNNTQLAKTGDVVVFSFKQNGHNDHIGFVVEDQVRATDSISTIEGNTTAAAGAADSNSGDGVVKKTRNPKIVSAYIRIIAN